MSSIKVKSTQSNAIFLLAEAVVNCEPGTTIVVDTEHMAKLAQDKMEQVHRDDLEIVVE